MAAAGRTRATGGATTGENGPVKKSKTAILLARDIVRAIYENKLKPGDRYFSEEEALRRHGVARNTLREALRYLEFQGALEIRPGPGGGAVVAQPDWTHLASTLALLLQFANAPLRSVFEARVAIDPGMAELAARNAGADDLARLDDALAQVEANLGDYRKFHQAYMRFWDHLAASTGNAILALLTPSMRRIIHSAVFVPTEPSRADLLVRLRRIRDAVARHDEPGARLATSEFDSDLLARLTKAYPRQLEGVVAWSDVDLNP